MGKDTGKPFWTSRLWWPYLFAAIIMTAMTVMDLCQGTQPSMERVGLLASLYGALVWRVITREPLRKSKIVKAQLPGF
jgi:hypothetical protein